MRARSLSVALFACLLAASTLAQADGAAAAISVEPFFFALSVTDAAVSSEWYQRVLGYDDLRATELPEHGVAIRVLSGPGGLLEIVEDRASRGRKDLGIERIARLQGVFKLGYAVASLDDAVDRLEALGVPLRGKVFTESDGSLRSTQIEDPDGNVIQLFERLGQP